MLSLFKARSYRIGDNIYNLNDGALPEKYWHRKVFDSCGKKVDISRVSEYGGIVSYIQYAKTLHEIEEFLINAHSRPDLLCMYSGVQKTYLKSMTNPETVMMRPTKEFFSIEATDTNIIAIDVDNWLVEGLEVTDINECGKYILGQLNKAAPEIFSLNSGYVIKASSSCGMKSGINYHVFFINQEPITIAQVKTIIKKVNYELGNFADPSVYSPGRLWYASKPLFIDPSIDPLLGKEFIQVVDGRDICIPNSTEADISRDLSKLNVSSIKKYFKNFKGIDPTSEELDPKIQTILDKIESGEISDLVWSKHSLHLIFMAIGNGYDLDLFLEKVLRPALVRYATKKRVRVDRYLEKIDYALKYATSTVLREISKDTLISRKILSQNKIENIDIQEIPANEYGYLSLPEPFPERNTINFIKSSLGTGKTTTVKNLIDEGKLKNVITITNRVSLVNSNARKLGLTSYKEMGTFSGAARGGGGGAVCV